MSAIADSAQPAIAGDRLQDYDGLRLLLSDIRVTGKLLNEARYHTTARLFGVSREDSALVTVVALGTLAALGHRTAVKLTKGPPLPEFGTVILTGGALTGAVQGVAGSVAGTVPGFGALVAFTIVATSVRPAIRKSLHEARAATHAARMGFDHRYGHILRVHRRSR